MADYIEFELNGRKLKINREDSNDLQIWMDTLGGNKLKNPYWRHVSLWKKNDYLCFSINYKKYHHHRVVYYAHNSTWNIHDSSRSNEIDHIDNNRHNNHISNLHVVSHAQNMSRITGWGVQYRPDCKKWVANISINRNQKHLGIFHTEEEAREAYLKAKEKASVTLS